MYKVLLHYSIPEWTDLELDAKSEEEARDLAILEIEAFAPEAVDIEIDEVQVVS